MNFRFLLETYKIIIPEIQRGYAQGRTDDVTKAKREKFLSVLATPEKKELNFIYGIIKNIGEEDVFFPMDGQQRLTTLFILHLYKAIQDDCLNDFLGLVFPNRNLRFRYETMPSGNIFLSNLLGHPELLKSLKEQKSFSKSIYYSSWYKFDWNKNPTITGMLNMLDSMHEKKMDTVSYSDLDKIEFEFIDIAKISRRINSDDLFIKINSTGRLLTPWEILKAKINQEINLNTAIQDKTSSKLFIDNQFMTSCKKILILASGQENITIKNIGDIEKIAMNIYCAASNDKKDMDIHAFLKLIDSIYKFFCREDTEVQDLSLKRKRQIRKTIAEGLCSAENVLSYPLRLRLKIIEMFYSLEKEKDLNENLWRIIYNILENTNYPDSEDDLNNQIESFNNIISWNINTEVKDIEQKGLYPNRVLKEEIAKYAYYGYLSSEIEDQEKHEYFKGLLSPVFILCGIDVNNNSYPKIESFKDEIGNVNEIFSDKLEKNFNNEFFKDGRLERFMLFHGNILFRGRALHMENDRDCSWSKFFSADDDSDNHREIFKKVVNDFLVEDNVKQYEAEELSFNLVPWTKYIFFLKGIYSNIGSFRFQYDRRYIHTFWLDNEEYHALLCKSQLNGNHIDLLLYTLFENFNMKEKWNICFSSYKDCLSTLKYNEENINIYAFNKVINGQNIIYIISDKELINMSVLEEQEKSIFDNTYISTPDSQDGYYAVKDLVCKNWYFYKCADVDSFKMILSMIGGKKLE